jgi:hypothetical protein
MVKYHHRVGAFVVRNLDPKVVVFAYFSLNEFYPPPLSLNEFLIFHLWGVEKVAEKRCKDVIK